MAGAAIQITRDELAALLESTDETITATYEDLLVRQSELLPDTFRDPLAAFLSRWWQARKAWGPRGVDMHEPDLEQLRLFLLHLQDWRARAAQKGATYTREMSARELQVARAVGLHMRLDRAPVDDPSERGVRRLGVAVAVLGGAVLIGALAYRGATRW